MTRNPGHRSQLSAGAEAIRIMEERKITSLVVVGTGERVEGVVHLHDLWRTEMI
jgi:arabinose-5-phosphate isomerase